MGRTPATNTVLLDRYAHIADGIAKLWYPYVEVVIHDLSTQKVVHLANTLSKRELGDESALDEIDQATQQKVLGPYEKVNWDGRKIRSVSSVLFDDAGVAIGMMCINFNVAVFGEMRAALDLLIQGAGTIEQPEELFRDDWQERINTLMHAWLQERRITLNAMTRDHRRQLVEALHAEGAFKGRSAANYVANVLGLGRATVYKYLKHIAG